MKYSFGLSDLTMNQLLDYFKSKPKIEMVKIYGSRARGDYRNGSDIDFAVWCDDIETVYNISKDLDELPTPYKFDVTNYKTLTHQEMINSINSEGVLFYERTN